MTPSKAIKIECRRCMNTEAFKGCASSLCRLNDLLLTKLKRIKTHCISCVPEQSIRGVRECTGGLLNGVTCPLHPYREGKNPKRKGIGNKNAFKNITHDALSVSIFN